MHQQRSRRAVLEQVAGDAAEYPLAETGMSVGPGYHDVDPGFRRDGVELAAVATR